MSAIAAWGSGLFTATLVSRESLHLAAVIETAVRRAERRRNVLSSR
ncbi:MAG TPA: hypothetical protein VFP80_12495 [Thermoanaerobaculia bacterium]|nr:hypothetical protein [Thermoanaerobaculia bacterium]